MGWDYVPTPGEVAEVARTGNPATPDEAARMVEFFHTYAELVGQVGNAAGRLQARLRENSEQLTAVYQ